MPEPSWAVDFDPTFEGWANQLPPPDAEALIAAIRVLRDQGPVLGRPLVDAVVGSRHKNMNELCPGFTGRTEVRMLFAFDPKRRAILVLVGDNSGDWSGWYEVNIPIADDRFDTHLARIEKKKGAGKKTTKAKGSKTK